MSFIISRVIFLSLADTVSQWQKGYRRWVWINHSINQDQDTKRRSTATKMANCVTGFSVNVASHYQQLQHRSISDHPIWSNGQTKFFRCGNAWVLDYTIIFVSFLIIFRTRVVQIKMWLILSCRVQIIHQDFVRK